MSSRFGSIQNIEQRILLGELMVLHNPLLKLIIPRFFTYTNGTMYPVGGNNGTTYPTGRANGKNILLVKLMVHNLLNN